MSLDDLPTGTPARPAAEAETVVRRVDRASPYPDKITRAEELRLQLADEIVRGALPPGAGLDETDIAKRFNVSRTPVREALRQLPAGGDPRGIAGPELCRQSRPVSRRQRALSQRDLCRLAERLYRRDHAGDAGAGAAVPPRPVPQSRPGGQIARRP